MTAFVHTWGSTAAERAARFPCDGVLPDAPMTLWRAVDVAAPVDVAFRRLCQLRVAPYSYDWIDNLGRRSPQSLTPGLERLEVGQRFMTIFRLVDFEPGRSITVRHHGAVFGEVVVTYRVTPAGDGASRLVVKLAVAPPRGPIGWAGRAVLPAGDLMMMRRQLLNLRALAERDAGAAP
jgi:hypothetical protein